MLLCSFGGPGTCYVDQAGFECPEIHLFLHQEYRDMKFVRGENNGDSRKERRGEKAHCEGLRQTRWCLMGMSSVNLGSRNQSFLNHLCVHHHPRLRSEPRTSCLPDRRAALELFLLPSHFRAHRALLGYL